MLEMQQIEPSARLGQFMRLMEDVEAEFIGLAIDALIAKLDARDGDADLEPSGDELDAAWPENNRHAAFAMVGARAFEDAEEDDEPEDDDEPEVDDEPEDSDEDCCAGGDDDMRGGLSPAYVMQAAMNPFWYVGAGDYEDAEPKEVPAFCLIHAPANDE